MLPPAAQGRARTDPMAKPFGARGLRRKYAANNRDAIQKYRGASSVYRDLPPEADISAEKIKIRKGRSRTHAPQQAAYLFNQRSRRP
jgi:hypothetical protein